jgi:hypothetical protein
MNEDVLTMHSPFPGMDPYLENPSLWPEFHAHLIHSLSLLLAPGLMERYGAGVAERRYAIGDREHREPFLEVHEVADGRLVTALEVVSPANKSSGPGRQAYLEKRREHRSQRGSLVEIDLLLQGQPVQEYAREGLPDWDYAVTVTRSVHPDRYEIYTATLDKRLPRFRLPLASDDRDTVLDLQAAVGRAHDLGEFAKRIDYRHDPPVKLSADREAWLNKLLAPLRPEANLSHDAIARLAYRFWEEAGQPHGRDQEYWYRAVAELKRGQ